MQRRSTLSIPEALVVSGICFGLFIGAWLLGALVTSPFDAEQGSQPIERMVADSRRPVLRPLVLAHILWDIVPFTTLAE